MRLQHVFLQPLPCGFFSTPTTCTHGAKLPPVLLPNLWQNEKFRWKQYAGGPHDFSHWKKFLTPRFGFALAVVSQLLICIYWGSLFCLFVMLRFLKPWPRPWNSWVWMLLESSWWVRVRWGDFVLFKHLVQNLLNIEQFCEQIQHENL
jgi:hypothetical protein